MKKVAMIGIGKLGQACAEVMAQYHDVIGFDIDHRTVSFPMANTIEETVKDREIVFIAVPTPHDPSYGGEIPSSHLKPKDFNYNILKSVLEELNKYVQQSTLIVIISTVLPGTIRKQLKKIVPGQRLLYNPYLIAMGTVKHDMINPEMIIIGNEDGTLDKDTLKLMEFYQPIMMNNPRYEVGTWDEAESIKIFYNTFISTKLALVNMIQDVAELNGNINVDVVTQALADSKKRIMSSAYMVAGMGDGGSCHPRDNIALRYLSQELGLGYDLFGAIVNARENQTKLLARKCLDHGKKITIVGKAFKPGVEFTHGSPSLLLGYFIEEMGGEVRYYDPATGDNNFNIDWSEVYVIGYWDKWVEELNFPEHSVVIDPWRQITKLQHKGMRIHYGNTRV